MNTLTHTRKFLTERQLLFLFAAVIVLMLIYIIVAGTAPAKLSANVNDGSTGRGNMVIQTDELLHARLFALQQMDREYASLANNGESTVSLEMSRLPIQQAESALLKAIDSIDTERKRMDEQTSSDLWKLTTYFKTIVENRRYLSQVKAGGSSQQDEQMLAGYAEAMREKDQLIQTLRRKSKAEEKSTMKIVRSENREMLNTPDQEELVYKPAPGETIEELRQRNINLRLAFNSTATEVGVLTKKYNLLKKEYDRLMREHPGSGLN